MRAFLEQYGIAIFVIVILASMILMASPAGKFVMNEAKNIFLQTTETTKPMTCNHNFKKESETTGTCTENGYITYRCEICGDTVQNKTAKANHKLKEQDRVNATCTTEGSVTYKCENCNLNDTITLMKTEHDFDFDKRIRTATKTETGLDQYKCSICSTTDNIEIPVKPSNEDGSQYSYKLMDGEGFSLYLHQNYTELGDVKKIKFTDVEAPDGLIIYDVSELQDESVLMWIDKTDRTLYISSGKSGKKVKANTSCETLFYSSNEMFKGTKEVDVTNLNVSNTKNMSKMFYGVGKEVGTFEIKGLETWDVSNVTNMAYMFSYVGQKATSFGIGNISGWNTGNVKDMDYMFHKICSGVVYEIDLTGWNTDNILTHKYFNTDVEDKVLAPNW